MDRQKIEKEEKILKDDIALAEKDAMGFKEEFLLFLKQYQVIGLAVAFVIGTAATAMVNALVKDIIMPVVSVLTPGGQWQTAVLAVGPINLLAGDFLSAVLDFLIIALVVFFLVKYVMKGDVTKKV
ncbi:Large-conductance mechanosensitive channel-like protein [Methanoregula boonei 6A8]|jgi:large conductance mechanosensitive channel|uniref:Large-conductance mechanosensitive channel-like protein n=1 Tax=Methanoregula boonei (strain DSM 21154 / JCM 14090 / 6A8) TaxID=456442 RepID=A7I494_METB6|nr:MscL family protein [Methanoregula boonei]ABS54555.1 Large-conductance mechanosensitive channel-like protein [Methanoregula boonei 6A8]